MKGEDTMNREKMKLIGIVVIVLIFPILFLCSVKYYFGPRRDIVALDFSQSFKAECGRDDLFLNIISIRRNYRGFDLKYPLIEYLIKYSINSSDFVEIDQDNPFFEKSIILPPDNTYTSTIEAVLMYSRRGFFKPWVMIGNGRGEI